MSSLRRPESLKIMERQMIWTATPGTTMGTRNRIR